MRPAAIRPFAAVPFVVLLVASACSDSAPTAPAHPTFDEALAQLSSGLRAASPGIDLAGGFSEAPPRVPASLCAPADDGDIECDDTPIDGINVSRHIFLYDLTGNTLPAWSDEVFAVRQLVELSGTRVIRIGDSTVTFELLAKDDHTLKGFGTPILRLVGSADATLTRTSGPGVQTVRTSRETDPRSGITAHRRRAPSSSP
jgi:hypothetical protein